MLVFFINSSIKFLVNVSVIFTICICLSTHINGIELYANTYYSYLDRLDKLNNKLLRILQGKTRRSNVLDLYESYNTLPLPQQHQFSVLVFVHKFVHHRDTLPDIFHNYFTLNSSVHNYATRQKDGLHLFNINMVNVLYVIRDVYYGMVSQPYCNRICQLVDSKLY